MTLVAVKKIPVRVYPGVDVGVRTCTISRPAAPHTLDAGIRVVLRPDIYKMRVAGQIITRGTRGGLCCVSPVTYVARTIFAIRDSKPPRHVAGDRNFLIGGHRIKVGDPTVVGKCSRVHIFSRDRCDWVVEKVKENEEGWLWTQYRSDRWW